ncbi:M56 family metallopeptidase [Agathobaculum sp. LCP25S3_E8]|uniref:M56 family metallopeptidase n=1 Tax=Agathobaculum sp. LCP25S3_E8 TaxID=3438735 RepID=UPI003F8F957D
MSLLAAVIRLSITGTFLAFIIAIVKKVLKNRISAQAHYLIWCILLLRLCIPFFGEISVPERNTVSEPSSITNDFQSDQIPDAPVATGIIDYESGELNEPTIDTGHIFRILVYAYVFGIIIYYSGLFLIILRNKYKENASVPPENLQQIFLQVKAEFSNLDHVRLVVGEANCAYAKGILFPTVVWPKAWSDKLPCDFSTAIFRHELFHIKGHDLLFRGVMVILQGIHWFNPFIWIAFAFARRDAEYACDERVLKHITEDDRYHYGHALIMAAQLSKSHTSPIIIGFANAPLKKRIQKITTYHASVKNRIFLIPTIFFILICAFMIGIRINHSPDSQTDQALNYSEESNITNLYYSFSEAWDSLVDKKTHYVLTNQNDLPVILDTLLHAEAINISPPQHDESNIPMIVLYLSGNDSLSLYLFSDNTMRKGDSWTQLPEGTFDKISHLLYSDRCSYLSSNFDKLFSGEAIHVMNHAFDYYMDANKVSRIKEIIYNAAWISVPSEQIPDFVYSQNSFSLYSDTQIELHFECDRRSLCVSLISSREQYWYTADSESFNSLYKLVSDSTTA